MAVTCVVVKEANVSILLRCDADGQRGVTENPIDLAGLVCGKSGVRYKLRETVSGCVGVCVYSGREGGSNLFWCLSLTGRRLPAFPAESSFSSSCCVSMLKRPTWPLWKDATMWAESVLTRSTEVGTPSSETHKQTHHQLCIELIRFICFRRMIDGWRVTKRWLMERQMN